MSRSHLYLDLSKPRESLSLNSLSHVEMNVLLNYSNALFHSCVVALSKKNECQTSLLALMCAVSFQFQCDMSKLSLRLFGNSFDVQKKVHNTNVMNMMCDFPHVSSISSV